MPYNFQKNQEESDLDTLLDNIFNVIDNEMEWECPKPKEDTPVVEDDSAMAYVRSLIEDCKNKLDSVHSSFENINDETNLNYYVMDLISINSSLNSLNEKLCDFQNAANNVSIKSDGNIQAVNDLITLM